MHNSSGRRLGARDLLGVPALPPGRATEVVNRMRSALAGLHRRTAPPPVQILEGLFGIFDTRVLGILVELGVIEALDRPRTAIQVAHEIGVGPEPLDRVLRYAAGRGFVGHGRRGRFRPNSVTRMLHRDHPGQWRGWVEFVNSDVFWDSWRHGDAPLLAAGRSGTEAATGEGFFDHVHRSRPDVGVAFDRAMQAGGQVHGLALASAIDWGSTTSVCDVGGGNGALLGVLIDRHPHLAGTVFDLPDVVARASDHPRLDAVGGDFFTEVPAGADRYLLVAVIHDWDDDQAAAILRNVGAACGRSGEVVVVENVLDDAPADTFAAASDLLMLVLGPGRERTRSGFDALFASSGLSMAGRTPLAPGTTAFRLRPT